MIICAVDPGAKGGICFMDYKTKEVIHTCSMPMVDKELDYLAVDELFVRYRPSEIWIEHVHAMPKQGVVSMFNFGRMYGGLKGLAHAYTYHVNTIRPQEWQKGLFGLQGWDKQVGIDYVLTNHPEVCLVPVRCRKPHDGISDAVCIAAYVCKEN